MAHNKYYIIKPPYNNIQEIIRVSVGLFENQRASVDGTKLVIKIPENDKGEYDFLKDLKPYTHDEILQILNTPEWVQKEF